jgi:hypothetical protein
MADTDEPTPTTEYPVVWVGRQPRPAVDPEQRPDSELTDPNTGKPPRSAVGRLRAVEAAATEAAQTPTVDADPPQHV